VKAISMASAAPRRRASVLVASPDIAVARGRHTRRRREVRLRLNAAPMTLEDVPGSRPRTHRYPAPRFGALTEAAPQSDGSARRGTVPANATIVFRLTA